MHELGIATSILECVQVEAQRYPDGRITKVGVKIGELSGVDRDALQFGIEVLVKDPEWEPLASAGLGICSTNAALFEVLLHVSYDEL